MKVQVEAFDEFTAGLDAVADDAAYERAVWVAVERQPLGANKRDAAAWDVTLHAGCVVLDGSGGDYLLELSIECGVDRSTAGGDNGGTDEAAELRHRLAEYCGRRGWTVRPGRVFT